MISGIKNLLRREAAAGSGDVLLPAVSQFDRSILADGSLGWLRFANAGMLDEDNVVAMDYAIARMPVGTAVVEIGCFCGLSTNVMALVRRRHGRSGEPFFAADPWRFEGADRDDVPMGDGGITFGGYRELVKDSFIRNVRAFSRHDMPFAVEADSDSFFAAWDEGATRTDVFGREVQLGGQIGFCYIDGDHRYEQARRDFENAARQMAPGGFILFDDSADDSGWEVCRVMEEMEVTADWELVGKFPNYLWRKVR